MGENGMGMSPADVYAMTNRGNGGWGDGCMWIIVLFALWMNSGWGNGYNNANNLATSNEVQRGFDNQNSMANQREILTAVNAGTAQSVAATNQTFHDILAAFGDKYTELQRDVANINMALLQASANQNECCCNTLRAIDGVNYNAAMNTAAINATTVEQTQRVLDAITGNRMAEMQAQINHLELNQAMQGVVRYPSAYTYNAGPSPFCGGGYCGNI